MRRDLEELAARREHRAPFGSGRLHAEAEEAERRADQHGLSGEQARLDDDDADGVRQDVAQQNAGRAHADGDRSADEILLPQLEHAAAHEPRERRHEAHGDGDDEARDARPDRGRDRDGEDEARHRQQEIDEPGDDAVDASAEIAGDAPERDADERGDEDRGHCDKERVTRAGDDAREDVAPDLVGAEGMCAASAGPSSRTGPGRVGS